MEKPIPQFLYKVLSMENWKASENNSILHLPEMDRDFIHLAREDQLEAIINKFWGYTAQFVVLKIDTSLLKGK